ncbi:BppU family phage baseplate upper protein [Enterococcus faecium]|uniref:BppU family phage baseplate upper protein n=2 Tax=Enterococcus faecium TaxID=1352 RepID=UPI0010257841|nr:BppU family phage baseplate upper protein [Enterococcus faecium]EGP4967590.1 BppU family phage baseplate upper protein [Enterococcus faecium]VFA77027.1 bactriophage minor structural protein [Enterococcus faecium]
MFKINESIIVIQAEATSPNRTNVVFWSHDRGTAKLRMKLVRKNGIPQSLPEGTTVPIRLMFRSATAEAGYGKHDYLATIEDRVNGIVSIVLEDNILGYVGTVEGSVYIDFPNDRSLDTAGRFTFYIKRSPIDDSTPELEDYYFNGFSQTIDKIEKILADGKLEIEQKIAESETQIDAKLKDTNDKITKANQDVATLNTNIDKANDRIDQTNQQIGDLGKLKKMYSNSIDFGDYDYSGNPNLMPVLKAKDFSPNSQITIEDSGNSLKVTFADSEGAKFLTSIKSVPALLPGTQYTLSADVTVLEGYKGDLNSLRLAYRKTPGGNILLYATARNAQVGKKTKIYATANSSAATDPSIFDRMYFTIDTTSTDPFVGTVLVENIKVERGSTATPYQPNLLDDPYWVGKAPLGDNLMTGTFPVSNSQYAILGRVLKKNLEIGKTYTATLKGTKPTTQTFAAYSGGTVKFGDFKPVEGLTDVWSVTFTVSNLSNSPANFTLYQQPQSTIGACQIDWLKIEKGNTRTPNISQFKYFGEGLKDSNNPNDYSWDITPEYAEKALTNTLNLTDPQTALGLKNFKDGVQIDGVDVATVKNLGSVLQSGSSLTTIQSDKQSAFDEFSYEFERIGDRVFFHARVKTNSTTAVASHVNLLEIPLGFQFPIGWTIVGIPLSVVQWTTPQGEISALVITDSNGKQVVKFATNRVGNHYISGEWRTADSYPETK